MSHRNWARALVLGGIRSGKSEFAEALVSSAPTVTFVATGRRDPDDPQWSARIDRHRARRPPGWSTVEVDDASALLKVLEAAGPADAVLVDDLGMWVAGQVPMWVAGHRPAPGVTQVTVSVDTESMADRLAAAVRACPATLVLVSPEVGLSVVPATAAGVAFADALGATNRAIAAECDAVVLVIAGNAVPVKGAL
jgi:nicotinate-nucleotide--dimethylbenzimidazole phosphoribosyltransferase